MGPYQHSKEPQHVLYQLYMALNMLKLIKAWTSRCGHYINKYILSFFLAEASSKHLASHHTIFLVKLTKILVCVLVLYLFVLIVLLCGDYHNLVLISDIRHSDD